MVRESLGKRKRRSEITYTISIRGSLPSDLAERISAIHASSILKAVSENGNDASGETKQIDTKQG